MKKLLIVAALVWALAPSTAHAEWLFTPYVGNSFDGGNGLTWGGSIGWMGAGILGAEFDFGFASDSLFNDNDSDLLGVDVDLFDNAVTTYMGNVLVGYPWGGTSGLGITPFFVGGLGLIRSNVDTNDDLFDFDSSDNNFGMDLGAGVMGFVSSNIGFRGDIRWFHSFDEPTLDFDLLDAGVVNRVDVPTVNLIEVDLDQSFWRATGGVTFRW
jgi:opacity protein-like surface antigen